jgi:hypothetical protein
VGGTSFVSQFTGGGLPAANAPFFTLDEFDSYSYEWFIAGKYKGFSFLNDWWVRDLNNFHAPNGGIDNAILYGPPAGVTLAPGTPTTFLFPNHPIIDWGMMLQCGYFIVPKKLEICGRWSWVRGESGDLFGSGKVLNTITLAGGPTSATVPGAAATAVPATKVGILADAFRHYHEADEFAIGVNYYFKRQYLKWQTDLSFYQGGNPAAGGQSPAGFIPGVDGWMIRTQIQLWF